MSTYFELLPADLRRHTAALLRREFNVAYEATLTSFKYGDIIGFNKNNTRAAQLREAVAYLEQRQQQ